MKNKFSKKILCLAVVALILIGGTKIGDALAYFTTYVLAEGEEKLVLGFTETIVKEEVTDGKKIVVLENTGTADCYVRVKVIVAEQYKEHISGSEPDNLDNWTDEVGGFYEYRTVLKAGESTTPLHIAISDLKTTPDENTDAFNVIIVQECAPVLYDDNGNTYADWDGSDFIIEKK